MRNPEYSHEFLKNRTNLEIIPYESHFGRKASVLKLLLEDSTIREYIPKTYFISTEVFLEFLQKSIVVKHEVFKLFELLASGSDRFEEKSLIVQDTIVNEYSEWLKMKKASIFADVLSLFKTNRVIVRSSGIEDEQTVANAGGNKSIGNVAIDEIWVAIAQVTASYLSYKSLMQLKLYNTFLSPDTLLYAVLIQEYINVPEERYPLNAVPILSIEIFGVIERLVKYLETYFGASTDSEWVIRSEKGVVSAVVFSYCQDCNYLQVQCSFGNGSAMDIKHGTNYMQYIIIGNEKNLPVVFGNAEMSGMQISLELSEVEIYLVQCRPLVSQNYYLQKNVDLMPYHEDKSARIKFNVQIISPGNGDAVGEFIITDTLSSAWNYYLRQDDIKKGEIVGCIVKAGSIMEHSGIMFSFAKKVIIKVVDDVFKNILRAGTNYFATDTSNCFLYVAMINETFTFSKEPINVNNFYLSNYFFLKNLQLYTTVDKDFFVLNSMDSFIKLCELKNTITSLLSNKHISNIKRILEDLDEYSPEHSSVISVLFMNRDKYQSVPLYRYLLSQIINGNNYIEAAGLTQIAESATNLIDRLIIECITLMGKKDIIRIILAYKDIIQVDEILLCVVLVNYDEDIQKIVLQNLILPDHISTINNILTKRDYYSISDYRQLCTIKLSREIEDLLQGYKLELNDLLLLSELCSPTGDEETTSKILESAIKEGLNLSDIISLSNIIYKYGGNGDFQNCISYCTSNDITWTKKIKSLHYGLSEKDRDSVNQSLHDININDLLIGARLLHSDIIEIKQYISQSTSVPPVMSNIVANMVSTLIEYYDILCKRCLISIGIGNAIVSNIWHYYRNLLYEWYQVFVELFNSSDKLYNDFSVFIQQQLCTKETVDHSFSLNIYNKWNEKILNKGDINLHEINNMIHQASIYYNNLCHPFKCSEYVKEVYFNLLSFDGYNRRLLLNNNQFIEVELGMGSNKLHKSSIRISKTKISASYVEAPQLEIGRIIIIESIFKVIREILPEYIFYSQISTLGTDYAFLVEINKENGEELSFTDTLKLSKVINSIFDAFELGGDIEFEQANSLIHIIILTNGFRQFLVKMIDYYSIIDFSSDMGGGMENDDKCIYQSLFGLIALFPERFSFLVAEYTYHELMSVLYKNLDKEEFLVDKYLLKENWIYEAYALIMCIMFPAEVLREISGNTNLDILLSKCDIYLKMIGHATGV